MGKRESRNPVDKYRKKEQKKEKLKQKEKIKIKKDIQDKEKLEKSSQQQLKNVSQNFQKQVLDPAFFKKAGNVASIDPSLLEADPEFLDKLIGGQHETKKLKKNEQEQESETSQVKLVNETLQNDNVNASVNQKQIIQPPTPLSLNNAPYMQKQSFSFAQLAKPINDESMKQQTFQNPFQNSQYQHYKFNSKQQASKTDDPFMMVTQVMDFDIFDKSQYDLATQKSTLPTPSQINPLRQMVQQQQNTNINQLQQKMSTVTSAPVITKSAQITTYGIDVRQQRQIFVPASIRNKTTQLNQTNSSLQTTSKGNDDQSQQKQFDKQMLQQIQKQSQNNIALGGSIKNITHVPAPKPFFSSPQNFDFQHDFDGQQNLLNSFMNEIKKVEQQLENNIDNIDAQEEEENQL